MIVLDDGSARFQFRVAGVALHDGRVLVHRAQRDDFWALPGGRVEMGEQAAGTLKREMQEEMGIEVTVGRLLWVVESFFTHEGLSFHELGFYFRMRLPHRSPLRQVDTFDGSETYMKSGEPARLIFQWLPVQSLSTVTLYPRLLRDGLQTLPRATQHVVDRDA